MIIKEHEDFARAVVALAREHKVNMVEFKFRLSGYALRNAGLPREGFETIDAHWHEGRHGVDAPIRMETSASATIDEKELQQQGQTA